MRKKNLVKITPETDDRVHLKPFLGIKPGVYLTILYSFIIGIILFFSLFFPVIRNPGSVIVFKSEPCGAALRIDDVYAGISPLKIFVPAGEHEFEIIMPGFNSEKLKIPVPSRIFTTVLFPKKIPLDIVLEPADPYKALAMYASVFAAWTFGGEPVPIWQIPLSLSEGVYRVGHYLAKADIQGIIAAAVRFASTKASLRDLLRANFLASGGGKPPSPLALLGSAKDIISFLDAHPNSAAWLADTLQSDIYSETGNYTETLTSSAWYQNQLAKNEDITGRENFSATSNRAGALPESQIRVGGLLFTEVSGGNLTQGEPYPHNVPVEPFLICTTTTPVSVYNDFLDANPEWRKDQTEDLISQGLVTSEYLADYSGTTEGINSVSWHAAEAFCKWLEKKLPESFSAYEIRLPKEAEWEYAAKLVQRGLITNIKINEEWEWCKDYYSPLPFFTASNKDIESVGSPERSIRGSSWVNRAGSVNAETRGFLPPSNCPPFVSFRPVIAKKSPGI